MATAVTAIETDELAVRQFLQSLFHKQDVAVTTDAATAMPVGGATAAGAAGAMAAAGAPLGVALRLHPRVDAAHPLVSHKGQLKKAVAGRFTGCSWMGASRPVGTTVNARPSIWPSTTLGMMTAPYTIAVATVAEAAIALNLHHMHMLQALLSMH